MKRWDWEHLWSADRQSREVVLSPSYVLKLAGMLLKYTDARAPPQPNEIRISGGRTQVSIFLKLLG